MSTFRNAYRLVEDVRRGINEYSTAYMEATDTSPTHSNALIVDEINKAQGFIYALLIKRIPGEFLASASLTGVASVFTLPSDYGKMVVFKDNYGNKVYPIEIDKLKRTGSTGNRRLYYRKGNTLVLDRDSITDTYVLWYRKRHRDLDMGKASGADTLATTSKAIADYYNGMYIENVSDSEADLITDYTAGRVITHTEVLDSGDYYGIVPDIPEMFLDLIAPRAIMQMKLLPTTMVTMTKFDTDNFNDMVISALRGFAGSSEDVTVEELFLDLEPAAPTRLGIVANVG